MTNEISEIWRRMDEYLEERRERGIYGFEERHYSREESIKLLKQKVKEYNLDSYVEKKVLGVGLNMLLDEKKHIDRVIGILSLKCGLLSPKSLEDWLKDGRV